MYIGYICWFIYDIFVGYYGIYLVVYKEYIIDDLCGVCLIDYMTYIWCLCELYLVVDM